MSKVYSYVGAACLNSLENLDAARTLVPFEGDIVAAIRRSKSPKKTEPIVFTFIVGFNGLLWIADRHSEHVACARGGDVLSAGELTFEVDGGIVIVTDITN